MPCLEADGGEQGTFSAFAVSHLPSAQNYFLPKWYILGWHILIPFIILSKQILSKAEPHQEITYYQIAFVCRVLPKVLSHLLFH